MERDAQSQPATSSAAAAKLKYAFRPGETRRRRGRRRAQTRLNLGGALPRWTKLRGRLRLRRDTDLTRLLLDSCQKRGSAIPASSKTLEKPLQNISTTDPSTDSQSNQIDGEDPDDEDMWETASEEASSDEDSAPSISQRTGGGKKIEED